MTGNCWASTLRFPTHPLPARKLRRLNNGWQRANWADSADRSAWGAPERKKNETTPHLADRLVFWLCEQPILNIVTEGRDLFKSTLDGSGLLNAEFQLPGLLANAWLLIPWGPSIGAIPIVAQVRVGIVRMINLFV
jgi:hypothetical protein